MNKFLPLSLMLFGFALVSTGCPGGGNGGGGGSDACEIDATPRSNQATYYTTSSPVGACGIPFSSLGSRAYMAVNPQFFDGGAGCGTCYLISGPEGSVVAQVVDSCPDCAADTAFDLSPGAFQQIAGTLSAGRVPVSYHQIPCESQGNIKIQFEGSHSFFLKVRVLNSENPIDSVELRNGTSWLAMTRTTDNAFMITPGFEMVAPYTFRITDVFGQVMTQSSAVIDNSNPVEGSSQFPACE